MTDEALMNETIAAMERLNIVGVLSGEEPERIAAWIAAAPGRFIPASSSGSALRALASRPTPCAASTLQNVAIRGSLRLLGNRGVPYPR